MSASAIAELSFIDHKASLLVFSRSTRCDRLPVAFKKDLADWIAFKEMKVAHLRFVGPSGRVEEGCLA